LPSSEEYHFVSEEELDSVADQMLWMSKEQGIATIEAL